MERHIRTHPGITPGDADNLAMRILAGQVEVPEFGLTRKALTRSRNPSNDVLARVERGLSGDRRIHRSCTQTVAEMPNRISTIFMHLLAHGRCDALAWIVICPHVGFINLPGPMGGRSIMTRNDHELPGAAYIADAHVHLGNDSYWAGEGTLDVGLSIPETALASAIGRPLSHLLSHPALDLMPMKVTGIDDNGGDGILIKTDYAEWSPFRRSIALAEILPIHLHPVLALAA